MPFFIILSITLGYIAQAIHPQPSFLTAPIVVHVGITAAVVCILLTHFKKLTNSICLDLFACFTLSAWFAYWKPFFNEDSPIFFFFPVYFALLTAFVTLLFNNQRSYVDYQSLQQMQLMADKSRLQPWLIMVGVLVSVELHDHYLLFPITMTLLILRYALSCCLEQDKLS